MAKTIQVELEAKTDKAIKELEGLQQEVKKLNEQVEKGNKDTASSLKKVETASEKTAGGIGKIGTALKAAGIGLAVAAFAKLTEVFNENQKVADFFNTTFETLSLAFNDFFNFLDRNISTVTGFFKSIFDDPAQSIADFGTAIKNNLIERFNSFLDTLGFVASAVKKVFSGDFAGALEDVKSAGKESLDVLTGVDNSFEKTVETVTNATSAIVNYTKSTISAAKENVELAKTAELAGARNQGLIEQYDLQAERLRQVRDEERNTIDERIKANNDLKAVLDEQETAMLANANAILAAAQAQFEKNQNTENELALLEAENELIAVQAQVAGFRSEQLANDLALNREKLELENSIKDAEAERQMENRNFLAEMEEGDVLRLQRTLENLQIENQAETQRLLQKRNLYQQGTQAYVDANNELLAYQQQNAQQQIQTEKQLAEAKMDMVSGALGSLAKIVGENSKFGKALAVTQAIMDTYKAANLALSSAPPPFNFIQMAAVIASGFVNVKNILKQKPPPAPSFAKGGAGGDVAIAAPSPPPTPTPPDINTVNASGMNQLADAIGEQTQQPVQAFVVSNDVTTAQSLERNIVDGASI